MTTCTHCGRVLTHPVYEYLGSGPICRQIHDTMKDAKLMKKVRSALKLTQDQMAERMGYSSRIRIADIERGHRQLSGPARKLLEQLKPNP